MLLQNVIHTPFVIRGDYDASTQYHVGDIVRFTVSGTSTAWVLLLPTTAGTAPAAASTVWGSLFDSILSGTGPGGTPAPLLMTQYSTDGNPPWRATYMAGDTHKRTSNDNGVTWSPAQRFRGEDGQGTPAPQTMIQYSTNGSPPWRNTYVAGDIFKRESTDGGMIWSPAIRFRGGDGTDGINGTDGTDGTDAVGTDGRDIIYETSSDGTTYVMPPAVASKVQFVRTRYQGQGLADAVVWTVGGSNGTTLTPQYSPDNSANSWGAYDAPTSRYMRPQLADGSYPSAGVLIRADDFSIVTQYSEDNNTFYDNTHPIATTVSFQRFGAKNERTGNINWFPSFPIGYSFDVSTAADVTVDNTNLGNNLPTTITNAQEAIDAIDDATFGGGLSAVATDSTLTGDGSTVNRLGIADGGVSTPQIVDGAVTNAKLANSAVNTAQLANDAVTADKIADHAIDQSKIADASVDTDELVDDAVTNAKIADNAVDTAQIEDDAVTLAKMASGTANMYIGYDASGDPAVLGAPGGGGLMTVASDATLTGTGTTADPIGVTPNGIDTAHLANNAVETAQIANGVVTTDKLANLAVTGAKIANATITNTKLANDAVDLAHMAHGTANHFIGYDASGAPAVIQLTTDTTLDGLGTPANALGIANGGVNTAQIADNAVSTAKVADNAITTAKMADNAVDTAHLANDAVTTAKIANNAITSAQIAGNAVTSSEIADDAVDTAEIVDMAVTQDKLANSSVGTAQLINDAVTQDKIADNAIGTAQIASNAVTSAEIATNAVTTGEIVNDAVTQDKIADDAVGTDQVADNAITNAQLASNAVDTAEIVTDAVTTDKIADNAVGLAQLAGGTAGAYLGFNASGDPAELTVPPGGLSSVSVDGTTIDGDGTPANPLQVADTGIDTAQLADTAVTGAKIADDAVDTAHLADDAVNTAQIADNAITSAQIAANSITTAEIQNDAVTGDKVADNAIANAQIADNAVSTAEVADNAITLGKMAHGAANMYLGYNASGEPAVLGQPGGGGLTSVVSDGTLSGDGTVGNALGVADDGIDTAQLADNAVETAQINNGAVTASKIADNTITATQIASDTITAAELAANAVNTTEIADNAVTNAKLADNIVGLAELAHGTADRFLGFNASGEPAELPAPSAGISSVASNATLSGDGTSGTPLSVADGGIGTAQLANDAVTNAKLADNAVNTAEIANDAVTNAKLADDAVDTAQIANDAVDTDQIANNAIETAQIAGDAVTQAKLADDSVGLAQLAHGTADRYLGFNASGAPAELTAPSGGGLSAVTSDGTLTGDGTSGDALGIANGGVNTTQLADDAVTTAKIANNAIENAQLADDAVGNSEIADNAVHTTQINDNAVTNAKLADDAVDTDEIANNAVTNAKLANNSVESAQIAQNAVGTSEIADDAVTLAKMAGGTADRYIGYDSSGNPAELSAPVGAGNTIMHIDAADTSVSGNTIVLSPTPAITSISASDTFHFQIPPTFSNTGAVSLRISNLTAHQLHNSKGENFFPGRIPAGRWVRAIFEMHLSNTFITNVDELPLEYVHEGAVTQTPSTPNEITLAVDDALPVLHHGDIYEFITKQTNTGDITLQINSIAAVSLVKPDGSEIGAGELPANRLVRITCDVSVGVYTFIADLNPINIPEATTSQAGLLSAPDKGKLDNLSVSGQAFHHVVPANVAATSDLITLTIPGITSYTEGLRIGFQMPGIAQQNAGIDLQINALGGRSIVKNTDLLNFGANELEVDSYIEVVFIALTDKFISNVPADYHTIFVRDTGVSHSGNDITLNPTFTPGSSSSVAFKFVTEETNTGDVTLLVNGIGINRSAMVKQDGSQYAAGELPVGLMLAVIYNTTNGQYWTANYNGPTGAGGLNQTEVDARIQVLVDLWAQVSSGDRIPDNKLPEIIPQNQAEAGTLQTIFSWTAQRVRQAANAAINALVSAWALVGNTDKVPNAKLPDLISQADAEAGTATNIVSVTAERVKQAVKALGSQLTVANLINTIYDKVHVTPITEIHGIDENYVYWSDTVARTGESGVNVVRVFYLQGDVSTVLTATEQQETFATGDLGKLELSAISGRIAAIRSANSDYAGEIVIAVRRRIGQVKGNVNNLAVHDFIHDAVSTGHWILARADAGSDDAYWERRLPSGEPVSVANSADAIFNNDSLPDGSSHFLFGMTTQSLTSDYFADIRDENDFPSWRATGTDTVRLNADPNAVDYTATTDLTEISLMGWANTASNILTTFFGDHHRRAPQSNTSSITRHEIVMRNGIVGDMFFADDPDSDTEIFETYVGTRTQFLLQGIMMLGLTFIFDEPQPESWARQGNADRLPDNKLHPAVTEAEAETGTETGLRSWSPLRVWDALREWFTQAEKDGLDKLIHQAVQSANEYNQVETIRNNDIWGADNQFVDIVDHKYFNDTHYIIGLLGEFNDQTLPNITANTSLRGFAIHSQTIYVFDRQNNLKFFDLNDYMEFGTALDLGSDDAIAMTIDESDETEMFVLFHANTTTVDIQNFTISTTVEDSTFTNHSNRLNISLTQVNSLLTANGFDAHQGNIFSTGPQRGVVSLSRLDNYLYILLSNVIKSGAGYNLRDCMIRVQLGGTSGASRTMTLDTNYFQELNYHPSSHTIDVYGGDDTNPEGVWLAEEFLIVGLERNVQHSTDLGDMPDAHDIAEINYALVETGGAYRRAKVFGEVVEYFGTSQTSRREPVHTITRHRSTQTDAILIWNATPAYHRNNGNTLLTLLSTPFPSFVEDHFDGYSGFTVPNNAIFRLPQGRYNIYLEMTTRTVGTSVFESFEFIEVADGTDHVIDGQYVAGKNYRDHLGNDRKFTIDLTEFVVNGTEYFYAAFNSTQATTNDVAYYAVIAKLD